MPKQRVNTYFFLLVLLAITVAFFRVIAPFLIDLVITAVLATVFMPVYRYCLSKTGRKKHLASAISTALVALVVVVPIIVMGVLIAQESRVYLKFLSGYAARLPDIRQTLLGIPLLGSFEKEISGFDFQAWIAGSVNKAAGILMPLTQQAFMNLYKMIFSFFIILIMLYFVFIEGPELTNRIRVLLPLKHRDQDIFVQRFKAITDATIRGIVIIAVMEAVVGSILLTLVHFPAPIIWGFVMLLLSILPIVGTNLVLVPIAVFKIYTGSFGEGVVLLIGVGFVLVSQYIIKPAVVGKGSDLHPAMVLISTLGGLIWLGIIGVIVGPVIAAFFISAWDIFEGHFKSELDETRIF